MYIILKEYTLNYIALSCCVRNTNITDEWCISKMIHINRGANIINKSAIFIEMAKCENSCNVSEHTICKHKRECQRVLINQRYNMYEP